MKIIVTTQEGLEEVCAREMANLDLQDIEILRRGVSCQGNWAQLYKCNYLLRTAVRVLVPIHEFDVNDQDEYYEAIKSINWTQYIKPDQTFAINSVITGELFTNSLFATFRAKDAIADRITEEKGSRPDVDIDNPSIVINIYVNQDKLSVALDSTGHSLHLRGYKERSYKAPLNEVFAAGIIKLAGWDGSQDFYDPMCGSGTFTTEALMMAANVPPGRLIKRFCFQNWTEYYPKIWRSIKRTAEEDIIAPKCNFYSSDLNPYATRDLRKNLQRIPFKEIVKIKEKDFLEETGQQDAILFLNPPYDKRIKIRDVKNFYRKISDALKQHWQGSTAWVISGNNQAMKSFGLKHSAKYSLDNGGIPSKLYKFELYGGSRKQKHNKAL